MDNITQRSVFDSEIKTVAAQLQELVTGNASHADIAMAESKLRELVATRRDYLYAPKDPSYYIDKVFSEYGQEDRSRVAEELEDSLIETLLSFKKESLETQGKEILNYDLLIDVLDFLRFFKNRNLKDQDATSVDESQPGEPSLLWNHRPELPIARFCDELVQEKYVTQANARILEAILEDPGNASKNYPRIDWQGSLDSITTFLLVSQYLGILNPEKARPKMKVKYNDKSGKESVSAPPVASIICTNFTVNGKRVAVSTISRKRLRKLLLELGVVRERALGLFAARGMGELTPENLTWDDILSCLFTLLDDPEVNKDELKGGLDCVDFEVLRFLNDLIGETGTDREEATRRLADLS